LISGIFREKQLFFKWYGGFYRKALDAFEHFFVQNSHSKELLLQLGKSNVTVSGDTRFDRVATILEKDNTLNFITEFKNNTLTIVVGSCWPKDESLLVAFINATSFPVKFILAPHNIKAEQIQELKQSISKKTVLFSEKEGKHLEDFEVFIIDTIGILTKIYSEADIAYVGGGFGNPGVHNILEPATFGVPIVIGPNFSHFAEATALVNMGGCVSISTGKELQDQFENLIQNVTIREEKGHICGTFVQMNIGATAQILNYIQKR
jgi:3-deoxy-D-manno-octulosonic-acid transferase